MSRTNHASKGPCYEYWSRRPAKLLNPGRQAKRLTHRAERREGVRSIRREDLTS